MKTPKQSSLKAQRVVAALTLFLLPSLSAGFAQSAFTKITTGPVANDFEESWCTKGIIKRGRELLSRIDYVLIKFDIDSHNRELSR